SEDGYIDYMEKSHVALSGIEVEPNPLAKVKPFSPWKPLDDKINLTWEYVGNRNPNTAEIPELKGVNVVSPTWFEVANEEGDVINNADLTYVRWAHNRGYQVW